MWGYGTIPTCAWWRWSVGFLEYTWHDLSFLGEDIWYWLRVFTHFSPTPLSSLSLNSLTPSLPFCCRPTSSTQPPASRRPMPSTPSLSHSLSFLLSLERRGPNYLLSSLVLFRKLIWGIRERDLSSHWRNELLETSIGQEFQGGRQNFGLLR